MRRRWPPLLLMSVLASFLLVTVPAAAVDRPPRNLHQVGDHWTAWEPPMDFPQGAEVYTIQAGDTLWDLAERFYRDPYLWPQLWERNQYILDAHWIYPGDPLLLSLEVQPVETLTELLGEEAGAGEEAVSERGTGILSSTDALGPPMPLGSESDIYCSGYVGDFDEEFPYAITGSEYGALLPNLFTAAQGGQRHNVRSVYGVGETAKYGLDTGDIVYLDGGRAGGLIPGQQLTVVSPRQKVQHPMTGKSYGRLYRYGGRVRVLSVQENSAIGEIVHTCEPITVGQRLEPFRAEPVPLGRDTPLWPVNLPVSAEQLKDAPVILLGHGDILSLGQDHVVYIDLGEADDVIPGDTFTVYRINRKGLPPIVIGELAVLSVHERSSVAKIVKSRRTIFLGDRLVAK